MKKEQLTRIALKTLVVVLIVAAVIVLPAWQVCRDWGYICENTGSRKGHREWFFGSKTGHWSEKSPLEEAIQSQAPEALVHRWTSYAGTGKNVFGGSLLFEHASPGAIINFPHEFQRLWIEKNDPAAVRELYDLLVSDDQDKIRKRIRDICDEVLEHER